MKIIEPTLYKQKIYNFRDLDTGRKYTVLAFNGTDAISKLNKKAGKEVNYTFLGYGK